MKILLWTIGLLIVLGVAAQILFKREVKKILGEIPDNVTLAYGRLDTNVFFGKIALEGVNLKKDGFELNTEVLEVSGLGYIPLLKDGDIVISELYLDKPFLTFRKLEEELDSSKNRSEFQKNISIKNTNIQDGKLKVFREKADSISVKLDGIYLMLQELVIDKQTLESEMPLWFENYKLDTQKGYFDLSTFEFIEWKNFHLDSESGYFKEFILRSKYNKKELSKILKVEHDYIDLVIDSIALVKPDFGFDSGSPKFDLAELYLYKPLIEVYRDKLLPDDTRLKKLYSQSLRELGFDLSVDFIGISKGEVNYQERIEAGIVPKKLRFTAVSAGIENLHSKGSGSVSVDIEAQLMGDGDLTLDWSFNPANQSNEFLVSGSLINFDSSHINPFLRTNMKAEVKGTVNEMYFTFSGGEFESSGDMKMKYDDFEFIVLKKNRLGVNKFLTAVVGIFTNNGQKTEEDGFRYGQYMVERNREKSFFNYLWLNVKEGLKETMSGSGKKK